MQALRGDKMKKPHLIPVVGTSDISAVWNKLGVRANLGTVFINDGQDRCWRVRAGVSRRKGRYLSFRIQGGEVSYRFRASADGYSSKHRTYFTVTPAEWSSFAELTSGKENEVAETKGGKTLQVARSALDRLILDYLTTD
jgi:hypothetical protein